MKGMPFQTVKKQDTEVLIVTGLARIDLSPPPSRPLPEKELPGKSANFAESDTENIEKPKRKYKRRDMQAE